MRIPKFVSSQIGKRVLFIGFAILLVACKPDVRINNTYQNEDSELIPLLLTEKEISEISDQFTWYSILSKQEGNVQVDTSSAFEFSSRKFLGYYKNSDNYVTIWQTVTKYNTPNNSEEIAFLGLGGVSDKDITSTYFPDIKTLGNVVSKCVTVREFEQICEVDIKYKYIESNLYISTTNIDKETVLNWLSTIVLVVEQRAIAQDFVK